MNMIYSHSPNCLPIPAARIVACFLYSVNRNMLFIVFNLSVAVTIPLLLPVSHSAFYQFYHFVQAVYIGIT